VREVETTTEAEPTLEDVEESANWATENLPGSPRGPSPATGAPALIYGRQTTGRAFVIGEGYHRIPNYYRFNVPVDISRPKVSKDYYNKNEVPMAFPGNWWVVNQSYDNYSRKYDQQVKQAAQHKAVATSPFTTKESRLTFIYRGNSDTDTNFTPRPPTEKNPKGDIMGDKKGLSTFISPQILWAKGYKKAQELDAQQLLREGFHLVVDGDHVSILPPASNPAQEQAFLEEWAATRPNLVEGAKHQPQSHLFTKKIHAANRGQVEKDK
jgi:hypothetical protein